MGELVVQVDVSGSISKRELDYYNGHMARIIELCKPERVHVLYVDTHVCKHETFEEGEEFKLEFYSGGGTDMEAGFEYLDKQGIQPEVIVVLTDGYTSFRPTSPASAPVVWCISTDVVAPYGETVPFTMEAWNESKSQ
jgi:predicted metal-dependent peptidase